VVLGADYPLLDVFWTILIFFTWMIWIWIVVVILIDVFRRRDIGGWSKAGWVIVLIALPFLGALIYLIAHHDTMAERNIGAMRDQQAALDDHIRSVAGGPSAEIASAKQLLDDGAIDQAEFAKLKAQALAGPAAA